jgi:hypothetical protein
MQDHNRFGLAVKNDGPSSVGLRFFLPVPSLFLKIWLAVLAVLFAIPAKAEVGDTPVRLCFETVRSLMTVKVTVNGQPKTLIFDTGAERTMIHERGVSLERQRTSLTLDSRTFVLPIIFVDLSDMPTAQAKADGVLGQDVLRKFARIEIDYSAHIVALYSAALSQSSSHHCPLASTLAWLVLLAQELEDPQLLMEFRNA